MSLVLAVHRVVLVADIGMRDLEFKTSLNETGQDIE